MDNIKVKLTSNWLQSGEADLAKVLQVDIIDQADNFHKIPLKDIINEDRSILLYKPQSQVENGPCELCMQLIMQYKIQAVHLVCNAIKVEIFQGQIKEYKETIYGELLQDDGDEEIEDGENNGFSKSIANNDLHLTFYRYDVEVEKSGITELTVRFLTANSEICIFGIRLNAAPNPNGITTLMANPSININMENVQNMLDNSPNASPSADKYRKFLDAMIKASNSAKYTGQQSQLSSNLNENEIKPQFAAELVADIDVNLRNYIDLKFIKLEQSIQQRLSTMEKRQDDKMAEMLDILQTLYRNRI